MLDCPGAFALEFFMSSGHIIAMVLATLVGMSLGSLGSGGSIITIPVLVYVVFAGLEPDLLARL